MKGNKSRSCCTLTLVLLIIILSSALYAEKKETDFEVSGEATVITSEKLTYDYGKKYALFEENVVVADPQLRLTADTLTVHFAEKGKAEEVLAEGNVHIIQEDKNARAGRATYKVTQGVIILEKNPRFYRDKDVLQADKITFFRFKNKIICEPHARLLIYPQEEGGTSKTFLFGE